MCTFTMRQRLSLVSTTGAPMGKKAPTRSNARALAFVMVLLVLAFAVYTVPSDLYSRYVIDADKELVGVNGVEGMYEATATILALVSFGSILGVKLNPNKDAAGRQRGGLLLVSGGSAVVIIIQVSVMTKLCCGSLFASQYIIHIGLTGLALMVIVLGYLVIAVAQDTVDSSRMTHKRIERAVSKTTRKPRGSPAKKTDTKRPQPNKPATKKPKAKARRTSGDNTSKGHQPPSGPP